MQIVITPEGTVVLRLFASDSYELDDDQVSWIKDAAVKACPEGPIAAIVSYYHTLPAPLLELLRCYPRPEIRPDAFFALKRLSAGQDFFLGSDEAFRFVTALYADIAGVLRRGGEWAFTTQEQYQVEYRADAGELIICFPERLIGLLIGAKGVNVTKVKKALSPVVRTMTVER